MRGTECVEVYVPRTQKLANRCTFRRNSRAYEESFHYLFPLAPKHKAFTGSAGFLVTKCDTDEQTADTQGKTLGGYENDDEGYHGTDTQQTLEPNSQSC
jgi:hypothetical protein